MQLFNKNFLLCLFIILSLGMMCAFPPESLANFDQRTALKIIVKDHRSNAVLLKNRGAYYYGLSQAKKIINKGQIVPREFIVKYKNHKSIVQIGATVNHKVFKTKVLNRNLGLTLVRLPKDKDYFKILEVLVKNPNVLYVEPNYIVKAQFSPNDPYSGQQWGLPMIKAESAWGKVDQAKLAKITIAFLDSGIYPYHEDLKDNIVPGYDFVNNDNDTSDVLGHGTHVAGIAAAITNNGIGISGIASGCKIMPIKVLDNDGTGDDAAIIEGIKYATDHGVQVINMSLGGPGSSDALQEAINYATIHGVSVVVAAGNENGTIDTPGNCQHVITVGAIDGDGKRASYSNYGPKLDILAPGTDILSTYIGGTGPSAYTYLSGTSMATPFVSGVVALIKALNPNLSPAAVQDILHQSATPLGKVRYSNYYGYGLVNAEKAVDITILGVDRIPFPEKSA